MADTHDRPVVRRHSLLKRNPNLDRAAFSEHYEHKHGPLASRQAGFRKYTQRYIQNHVEGTPETVDTAFDGVTMTTQVPRDDYSTGFFTEPDYENVKPDETYLFDLTKTVSLIGEEQISFDGPATRWKVLLLIAARRFDAEAFSGVSRIALNRLETSTASALGFNSSTFEYDLLAELWFTSEAQRDTAFQDAQGWGESEPAPIFLPVREVLVFGPEKPWKPD